MKEIKKKVASIQFSLISAEQIKKMAAAKIVTPELYDIDGYPVDGGLMDLRLGAIDPGVRCRTCGKGLKECLGHIGYIELARPVLHINYISLIEMFLNSFCEVCGKFLLTQKDIEKYKLNDRIKKAKKVKKCPHCDSVQEKVKLERPFYFFVGKKRLFPVEIRERLEKISDEDCKKVGVNPKTCRPEWAVLTLLIVPPVTVRPSITLETGERSEDDLTHKLSDIVRSNQRLWENLNAGAPEVIIEDLWDLLQYHVTTFFDNTIAKIPPSRHRSGHPLKTIAERIKGKEGRIRHNLAGKRVNFSSRTVVSPEPFMRICDIGIPYEIAKIITVKEMVTEKNKERLKKFILNKGYPSANYIIRPDGKKKRITDELREELANEIEIGYIVERHLMDGDVVLFNRHPSLHKASLMAHYAKIMSGKTFRLHLCATFPYNADFDGDEMNIHGPQNEEARAEAIYLLDIRNNLISPKNNTAVLGCITDALTGNFILSMNELSKEDASQIIYGLNIEPKITTNKVSGREVFSEILPKVDFSIRTKACLGEDCPNYDKNSADPYNKCKKEKCPNNAYLSINKGKLVSGLVDKYTFGVEDSILIKILDREVGREKTIETIEKAFRLGTHFLTKHGLTISIEDINVKEEIKKISQEIIAAAKERVHEVINQYYDGTLKQLPGKTREETREIKILQILNETRSKIGEIIKKNFPKSNLISAMIDSGAGGSILNISQMACSVGQQSLWGKRIDFGFEERTLSRFKKNDLSPEARGFVNSSFLNGLKPHEFFFSSMTGRDGLMDTALRTPKSGYLYRRLVNALQDIRVEYDGTVRDAGSNIIQFKYGNDGVDVSKMHLKKNQIAPGEAIGVVTAQSIGEPSTQMVLNVFHFSGVSEMAVTSGLPRLIEIFDARKNPITPSMEIYVEKNLDKKEVEVLAEKIKEIKLKDISTQINLNFSDGKMEISIDKSALKETHSSIESVIKKIKEKGYDARQGKEDSIVIKFGESNFKEMFQKKEKIKEILISGVKGISEVLPIKKGKDYVILTAGSNLEEVLKLKGVDKERTTTNNIYEIQKIFGIEAARESIIRETLKVFESQGLDINSKHIELIADVMTVSGTLKGITRMGVISEKSSVLARASFETPIKHFVNASITGIKDELNSVIENIILNQPVPIGTGLPGLLVKVTGKLTEK